MYYTALIIFIITYTGIIFTRLPGMNIDRPSAAFFGAVAMILFGVLNFDEAIHSIDFNTIALLLGMMIIGAMANLIVIESAGNHGIRIRFWEFMKSGAIVTILTLLVSFGILCMRLSL